MHGLINRAVECFLRDTYGEARWRRIAAAANLESPGFEAMLAYDDSVTEDVLGAATADLGKCRDDLLEDLGTYLVSHPNVEAVRRLLRFGGLNFPDFLHSLEDLPERARLAVPDLILPALELLELAKGRYELHCHCEAPGFGVVLAGLLRAMADDYGALVSLDHDRRGEVEILTVDLHEVAFAEGRNFSLSVAL